MSVYVSRLLSSLTPVSIAESTLRRREGLSGNALDEIKSALDRSAEANSQLRLLVPPEVSNIALRLVIEQRQMSTDSRPTIETAKLVQQHVMDRVRILRFEKCGLTQLNQGRFLEGHDFQRCMGPF